MKNLLLKEIERNIRLNAKANMQHQVRRETDRARQVAKVCGLLAQAGVPVTFTPNLADHGHIHLTTDQLVAARHALGKFTHYSTEPGEDDQHVKVKLSCNDYDRVYILYSRTLPEGSKCKVRTVTQTYTTRSLCCSR
jgi:hypothetical protein